MQRRQFVSLASCAAAAVGAPLWARTAHAQEAGLTAKTIAIGCSAATTGPLAGFGQDVRLGAGAALAQINRSGGIHGRELQFNLLDDAYDPQRSVANVKQLLAQGSAFAMLSCVGTPNNTALLPLLEDAGVPYVGPVTGASSLRKRSRNLFHVRASYTDEMRTLVQRLTGMGLKGIGIVYQDNLFGQEMLGDATRELTASGMQPAVAVALATNGSNLQDAVAKVVAARPSAVLLATAGSVSVGLVQGLKKGMPGLLMAGLSVTLTGEAFKQLGEAGNGLAMSIVVPNPFRTSTAVVRDYQAALRATAPDQVFSLGSLEAYINMRVLAEGLERAGRDPSQAKLRSALASIRNWDLGGFVVDYSGQAPHVGSRFIGMGILNSTGRLST